MEDIVESLRLTADDTDAVENASVAYLLEEAAAEIERLRQAIRRLADQDATLSVCAGNVTVTMDATLTDAEREAVERARAAYADHYDDPEMVEIATTLLGLLTRAGGET